jgi:hypothetical protein
MIVLLPQKGFGARIFPRSLLRGKLIDMLAMRYKR